MTNRSYKDLMVWQKAIEQTVFVYEMAKAFPNEEMYGLASQIKRAAVSIPSNIAEGSERRSDKDFLRFLRIANGSNAELETQLYVALKLGFVSSEHYFKCQQMASEIGRMINGLANSLNENLAGNRPLKTGD